MTFFGRREEGPVRPPKTPPSLAEPIKSSLGLYMEREHRHTLRCLSARIPPPNYPRSRTIASSRARLLTFTTFGVDGVARSTSSSLLNHHKTELECKWLSNRSRK